MDRCMNCSACIRNCGSITFNESGLKFDKNTCKQCGNCAEVCPQNAIEIKGIHYPPEKLSKEILKDKAFFKNGGGITFGGGEPILNADYLKEVMPILKEQGIHIAVDTAGHYTYSVIESLAKHIDLVLFDIKIFDNEAHKKFTGVGNSLILENAKRLGSQDKFKVWVRTPIIPNTTDSVENISQIGAFIKEHMPNTQRWELMAFNNLCKKKYELLGETWEYENASLTSEAKASELLNEARKHMKIASLSGMLKR